MPHPSKSQSHAGQPSRDWPGVVLLIAAIAGLAIAAAAGLASAKVSNPTVATAHNARLHETVLVDRRGFTLYTLSPETSHHLLCKSSACISFWPPLKAASAKAKLIKGAGIKGKLATISRKGFAQVTLNGHPLYRFSGDSAKGQANGQGIASFGGVWHAAKAGAAGSTTTTTTSTTSTNPTTTSTSSTYTYPMY
jgi:predicted lipoprotein with Yx(FWY)xxD motif